MSKVMAGSFASRNVAGAGAFLQFTAFFAPRAAVEVSGSGTNGIAQFDVKWAAPG
jgi:hypothetical protein